MKPHVSGIAMLVIISSESCLSWSSYSHFKITGDAGATDIAPLANLPDIYPSRDGVSVTPHFCWSHACQKRGAFDGLCPVAPSAYLHPAGIGANDPKAVMITLYKKLASNRRDSLMVRTAKGFAAHNAADSKVHFNYFLGGEVDHEVCAQNWYVHHMNKEIWADYILFANSIGCLKNGCDYQQWDSHPQPAMTACGHAGLICLAQKVYRKKAQNVCDPGMCGQSEVDCCGPEGLPVESMSQIALKINDQSQVLALVRFYHSSFIDWYNYGDTKGWDFEELLQKESEARAAAQGAVQGTNP